MDSADASGANPPAPACPKCGQRAPAPNVVACARCGLLRSRWATFRAQIAPHPGLDPLWQAALSDWENPQRHQALHKVATTDWTLLSAVSQRYSQVLRERPDDATAKLAMDRLIEAAIGLPLPQQRRVSEGFGKATQVTRALMGVGMLVLAVLLALSALRR